MFHPTHFSANTGEKIFKNSQADRSNKSTANGEKPFLVCVSRKTQRITSESPKSASEAVTLLVLGKIRMSPERYVTKLKKNAINSTLKKEAW